MDQDAIEERLERLEAINLAPPGAPLSGPGVWRHVTEQDGRTHMKMNFYRNEAGRTGAEKYSLMLNEAGIPNRPGQKNDTGGQENFISIAPEDFDKITKSAVSRMQESLKSVLQTPQPSQPEIRTGEDTVEISAAKMDEVRRQVREAQEVKSGGAFARLVNRFRPAGR